MLAKALMSFSVLSLNEKISALLILQVHCEEQINIIGLSALKMARY